MALSLRDLARSFRPVIGLGAPVYVMTLPEFVLFYAPGLGCAVSRSVSAAFEDLLRQSAGARAGTDEVGDPESGLRRWAQRLIAKAESAEGRWSRMLDGGFSPECLTVSLERKCNLRCTYCFTRAERAGDAALDLAAVRAAARLVAANCSLLGRPLWLALQGAGEPTQDVATIERVLSAVRDVADEFGIELRSYIGTNGVMPPSTAEWLGRNFDLVGLSCDGPPHIHDRYRRTLGGEPTSGRVAETGRILGSQSGRLRVRATITRESAGQQAAIVDYLCSTFEPQEITFEPVYASAGGALPLALYPRDVDEYAEGFLAARAAGLERDTRVVAAGVRVDEVHGPHCHSARNVVHIIPGNIATGCFRLTQPKDCERSDMVVGAYHPEADRFVVDDRRRSEINEALRGLRSECRACFNRFHCARGCPEVCEVLSGDEVVGRRWIGRRHDYEEELSASHRAEFRCQVQRLIAVGIISRRAAKLWSDARESGATVAGAESWSPRADAT